MHVCCFVVSMNLSS